MKRTIGIVIIYLIQILLLVLFLVPDFRSYVNENISFLNHFWDGYKAIIEWFGGLIHIDVLTSSNHRISNMLSVITLNIVFTVLYNLIVLILVKVSKSKRKKKLLNNNLKLYELSEEEKAKFNYKLYEKKFSLKGTISYIVPIFIVFFITVVRFDKVICEVDLYRGGYFTFYTNNIRPFLNSIHPGLVEAIEAISYNYIIFINQIIDIVRIEFIEYLFIVFFSILLFILWTIIVLIFVKANKTHAAKRRARIAREKYITKMEKYELSSREKVEDRISSKAREILGDEIQELSLQEDASSISIVNEKYIGTDSQSIKSQADYIDDISTGVVDLGVVGTGDEESEPIERKIPVFVGEEEVDITLDREPLVEVEEEDVYEDIEEDEMPFFEKYSPELTDYSYIDESLLKNQVEVVDDNQDEKEEIFAKVQNYEDKLEQIETETIEEIIEENIAFDDTPNEEVSTEETPKEEVIKIIYKEEKKKKIKPIDIKKRTKEERFKNAKQKYFAYKKETEDKSFVVKKRNLIRRKYKK